jgi:hypothetical protein
MAGNNGTRVSLDHRGSLRQYFRGYNNIQRIGCFEVDNQLDPDRLLEVFAAMAEEYVRNGPLGVYSVVRCRPPAWLMQRAFLFSRRSFGGVSTCSGCPIGASKVIRKLLRIGGNGLYAVKNIPASPHQLTGLTGASVKRQLANRSRAWASSPGDPRRFQGN